MPFMSDTIDRILPTPAAGAQPAPASRAYLPYPNAAISAQGTPGKPCPLARMRLAVSDTIDVAGFPTSLGNATLLAAGGLRTRSAACVEALLAAGARLTGKTVCGELGLDETEANPHFCAAANPRDGSLALGGSAGGAACAVAEDSADVALAGDCAGSALVPAAQCGICALRFGSGRVAAQGMHLLGDGLEAPALLATRLETLTQAAGFLLPRADDDERATGNSPSRPRLLVPVDLLTFYGPRAFADFEPVLQMAQTAFGRAAFVNASPLKLSEIYRSFELLKARAVWERYGNLLETLHPKLGTAVSEMLASSFLLQHEDSDGASCHRQAVQKHFSRLLQGENGGNAPQKDKAQSPVPFLLLPALPGAPIRRDAPQEALERRRIELATVHGLLMLAGAAVATLPVPMDLPGDGAPQSVTNVMLVGAPDREMDLLSIGRRLLAPRSE